MSLENRKPAEEKIVASRANQPLNSQVTMSYNKNESGTEIDLVDLAYMLFDKLHFIVMFFLVGAVLCNAFSFFCIKPTYQSTAKLYIVSASEDSIVNLSDLNIGSSLTSDYEELMLSYPVLDQVIDKLGLNMDSAGLSQMISLENPADTRVLKITVTSTDPKQARDIANTLAEISVGYLPDTMSTRAPNIAQRAILPETKSGPSYMKFTILGGFLGAIVVCIILVVQYLLDDTIHTAEDLEKYFGIVPLTSIPESEQFIMRTGKFTGKTKNKNRRKGRS